MGVRNSRRKNVKTKVKTALSNKIKWYDEITFVSELIAKLYTYMANGDKDLLQDVFEKLGNRHGFKFTPIASASRARGG